VRAEPGSGSDLPAPYRHPWRLLADDLRAVAASLVLKARELWRRNGEGDLWRPPFWPRSLGALFWPALLSALVGMVVFLSLRSGPTRLQSGVPAPLAPAAPAAPAEPPASPPAPQELPSEPPPDPVAVALPDPDPLLLAIGEGESDPLILTALADPARSELRLGLEPSFGALTAADQQARAEHWLARSQELGFEHLDLRDGSGRLLGRSALVGSGMILLDSTLPS